MESELLIEVGSIFRDKQQLQAACQKFALQANSEYSTYKSDKTYLILECVDKACKWRLHASSTDPPTFEIKSMYSEHTCIGVRHLGHRQSLHNI
jgi:MuDR family transposase